MTVAIVFGTVNGVPYMLDIHTMGTPLTKSMRGDIMCCATS